MLCNVYLLYKLAASPKINLAFSANILTQHKQHNARCKLEHHCSFGLKFNVPVDFLLLRSQLKLLVRKFSLSGVAKAVNKMGKIRTNSK